MTKLHFVIVLVILGFSYGLDPWDDKDRNVTQLITNRGYPVEEHTVLTSDGFLLGLQRIPHGRKGGQPQSKKVVILQHGLLDTAATWVLNSETESLGYILADDGYDVWLANSRGNTYSMSSKVYNVTQEQFWNWSWDEQATYDFPAVLHFVTNATGVTKVSFIGHCQGATTALAGLSSNALLAEKLNLFVAIAPVAYMTHQNSSLLDTLATFGVDAILESFGDGKFSPTPAVLDRLLGVFCQVTPYLCNNVLGSLFGPDNNLNNSRMGVYASHWPDSTSVQNLVHWIKNARTGLFQSYTGVQYDPTKIAVPVAVYYGQHDELADPTDVKTLISKLVSVADSKQLMDYAHMDFVWSTSAAQLFYPKILALLQKYDS